MVSSCFFQRRHSHASAPSLVSACLVVAIMDHGPSSHTEREQHCVVGISDQGSRQKALDGVSQPRCCFHVHYQCCTWCGSRSLVSLVSLCLVQRRHSHTSVTTPPNRCYHSCYQLPSRKTHVAIVSTLFEDIILIGQWNLGSPVCLLCLCSACCWRSPGFCNVVSVCVARDHQAILKQSSALLLASVSRVTGR